MFINYKTALLNYSLMLLFVPLITLLQNSFITSVFGTSTPIYLWIPYLIYWALYRKPWEAVFIVYFVSFSIASTSPLLASYILAFNSLVLLTLLFLKKVYYTSWMFFSIACFLILTLCPISLWVLSQFMDGIAYFHTLIPWIKGVSITWSLSFPLLLFFHWIDQLTIIKPVEHKKVGIV